MAAQHGRILVVEDDPDVRDIIVSHLTAIGHGVDEAADAEQALATLRGDRPIDVLFTDIILAGGMNGFRLAREAVMLRPSLKVLYATGYAHPVREKEPLLARGEILSKPFRLAQLEAALDEVLRARPYTLNRVHRRLLNHWRTARGGRSLPARSDISLALLDEIAPDIAIAEVVTPPPDLTCRFTYFGATLVRSIGRNPVGLRPEEVSLGGYADFIRKLYGDVVEKAQGLYAASYFSGPERMFTERLMLPVSRDGTHVDGILAAQTFDRISHEMTPLEIVRQSTGRTDILEPVAEPAP